MKKWKFKNETPRFDGEYLCHIRVTEECGNKYKTNRDKNTRRDCGGIGH